VGSIPITRSTRRGAHRSPKIDFVRGLAAP
jgi:hypothetical protein